MQRIVNTDEAPPAVGAYSQATSDESLLFTSGQLPMTPSGELLDDEPVTEQTKQCLRNVAAILAAEGCDPSDVLKVTVFLGDIEDFDEMNETYAEFFDESPPARSAVEVGAVPKGAALEIEAVVSVE